MPLVNDVVWGELNRLAALYERGDHQPIPDASQGSARETQLREPRCQCHLEVGDSPCPVHGDYSGEPAASQGSAPVTDPYERAHAEAYLEHPRPPAAPQRSPLPVALALVHEQAEDAGLWFVDPKTAAEAYLQRALRALHAAVEASQGNPPEGSSLPGVAWPKDTVETVARAIFAADALHSEGGDVAWDGITAEYQEDMRAVALAALAAAATPEGRVLEGELAEALRDEHETVRRWLRRIHKCAERCVTCALLARFDAAKAIPQSGTVKEGTGG